MLKTPSSIIDLFTKLSIVDDIVKEYKHANSNERENEEYTRKPTDEEFRICKETEYKCTKCRDMTFIINDGVAIANELMDRWIGVIYIGYRDSITNIKQNMLDSVYYNKVMNRYKGARVIFIDDLFKGKIA